MQTDLLTPGKGGMKLDSKQIETLVTNVNNNIHLADSLHIPVIYIKNEWTNPFWIYFAGNICKKGEKGTEFDSRLPIVDSLVFSKSVPNSFSNKELVKYLDQNVIKTVFIIGIKTEACAGATTRDSMKRGFQTFIITPALGSNSTKTLKKSIDRLIKEGAIPAESIIDR